MRLPHEWGSKFDIALGKTKVFSDNRNIEICDRETWG